MQLRHGIGSSVRAAALVFAKAFWAVRNRLTEAIRPRRRIAARYNKAIVSVKNTFARVFFECLAD